MKNNLLKFEIAGLFFVMTMSVFLQNLYNLSGKNIAGIIFGSVNSSIWEITKTLVSAYIFWAIIEIICISPSFHRFVVAKVISVYFLTIFYILICLVFTAFDGNNYSMPEFIGAIAAVLSASFLSYRLLNSELKLQNLFIPSIFMLLLFLALYFSFTPFPPQNYIFMDRATGIYGLIPDYIDSGDLVLDTIYHIA